MQIPTLQEMWAEYKAKCYSGQISEVQNQECHRAFMAGAMKMLHLVGFIAERMPEDRAVKELDKLHAEGRVFALDVLSEVRHRGN